MTDWTADYVGLRYAPHGRTRDGVDCWGLVRLVMAEKRGLQLPDYGDGYTAAEDRASVPQAIRRGLRDGWRQLERPEPGALVVFAIGGLPMHCGIVVTPTRFMHVLRGIDVALERLDALMWVRRIEGYYRYG